MTCRTRQDVSFEAMQVTLDKVGDDFKAALVFADTGTQGLALLREESAFEKVARRALLTNGPH